MSFGCGKRRLNTYGAQILFLTVLDLIVTCNLLGYNVYAYFVREIHHAEVLRYMVLCVLLYIFGVAFVGILFGAFAAMYMNRFAALSLLTLATFLISPFALFLVESFCMIMT